MKNKKTPMRRCVGCMSSRPKNELIRIAAYEGDVSIDPTGKAKGRGVYVCPDLQCLKKAEKRNALARSLSVEISKEQMEKLFEELRTYEAKD
ncbi:MAG: YlxR family protein [Eubacteriales bacterium]|jgi:hypothetical protein|nr:YlxR family protein [Eubacteriales bacterium]NLF47391.1 YlxR family protein [Clostridiales bacterium]